MKRFLAFVFAFLLLLSPAVLAHSGGTDANGGHYDRSTGKYHYHHGYPAHQHYDMNGDGVVDCPYNFDDQTGRNSGGSSTKQRATPAPAVKPTQTPRPTPTPKPKETKTSNTGAMIALSVAAVPIGAITLAAVCWPVSALVHAIVDRHSGKGKKGGDGK